MGTRGPVRDPDSRRGRREVRQGIVTPFVAEPITFPTDDDKSVEALFQEIVDDLIAAEIPVKQKDAHAIKCVAQNLHNLQVLGKRMDDPEMDGKVFLKTASLCASLTKDIMKDLAALGATPVATMRLIKTPAKIAENPAVDDIVNAS